MNYDHRLIEQEVKKKHEQSNPFFTDTHQEDDKEKYYSLGMFPYPSGNAHMGHVRVYTISDVKSRFKKLLQKKTLHPIGWDSFGLPAENAAIKNKVAPDKWTKINIDQMKNEQLNNAGWSFDWSKEINTSSPEYYKWTQWLFLQLLKNGKAYKSSEIVNWCNIDQTTLANEQVINGRCWRDNSIVEKRKMEQWFIKTTDYAERMWNDINLLKNWSPEAIAVQKNWIGRKEGSNVLFKIPGMGEEISVFTTRIDTLFGVTAIVMAPEHPLVEKILKINQNEEIDSYVKNAIKKSQVERLQLKEKTGVNTSIKCLHPLTNKEIDIWIGDYVIADFGTGAVMCVPAHDSRDFIFSKKYSLNYIQVISNKETEVSSSKDQNDAITEDGILINSDKFSNLTSSEARQKITEELEGLKSGHKTITYQLKDWSIGRQRYWGCPIPIIYCENCGTVPVPESELPVMLPKNTEFSDDNIVSLKDNHDFVNTTCPKCNAKAKRETDTLDTFLCSSWYMFRYLDPNNDKQIFDSNIVNKWMPVDFYVGGLEHAAQHMIYARFLTKFLNDIGLIDFTEPVDSFFCNGIVKKDGSKMSKSKGNVVVPTEAINEHGADAVRLYILSDTPADMDIDWSSSGIKVKKDFIGKNFRNISNFLKENINVDESYSSINIFADKEKLYDFFTSLNALYDAINQNSFHTGVAKIYELSNTINNLITKIDKSDVESITILKNLIKNYIIVFGIFAPFTSEYLFNTYFKNCDFNSLSFPEILKNYLEKNEANVVIQVNGKKRDLIKVKKGIPKEEIEEIIFSNPKINQFTNGKKIIKKIYINNKIYNIVVK